MPRKGRLDTAAVVQAAADLVNAEGAPALALGRLAEKLGIQTPSLYNHVDGLPGLERELARLNARQLADRLSAAAIGRAGADGVWAVAEAFRAYIKEQPGLYLSTLRAAGAQATPDPELLAAETKVVTVCVAVLTPLGLAGDDAVHAVRGLRSLVHGFATLEIAGGFGMPLDCDESFRRLVTVFIAGLAPAPRATWKR